ncbi:MAG: gltX 2, partial [Thermoleophilia bacterium]|nr:gltX 2 [Thermoleophilia bacterium]
VVVPAGSFGDPVLCRADGSAGYLLASVVDDVDLAITHVVRGEDHLTNTARQLLIFEALEAAPPAFAHLPLLRDSDGRKLSKRDPLGTLDELVDEAFLPVTVRRYLAELLGQGAVDLTPPDGTAVALRLERVPTGAPKVDRARLESLGREDMANVPLEELLDGTLVDLTDGLAPLVAELAASAPTRVALRGELRLVLDGPGAGDLPHVLAIVLPGREELQRADAVLQLAVAELRADPASVGGADTGPVWAAPFLARYRATGAEQGFGTRDAMRPLRVALTGTSGGPSLELVLGAIGAREALRRVQLALLVLEEELSGNQAVDG